VVGTLGRSLGLPLVVVLTGDPGCQLKIKVRDCIMIEGKVEGVYKYYIIRVIENSTFTKKGNNA